MIKIKAQIRLDTMCDVNRFVSIASMQKGKVYITDDNGLKVSAKSLLGALYALEFDELWCESEDDIWTAIKDFIVV